MVELQKRTGARIAYGLLSGRTDLGRLIREARQLASAGALLAVEGNNKPNDWGITYQGEVGGGNKSWVSIVIELAASGAPSAAQNHGQTERKS